MLLGAELAALSSALYLAALYFVLNLLELFPFSICFVCLPLSLQA